MARKEYQTGGGVVIHEEKVLLLDRPGRGEVRLPKGHIDPGETAREAALRETREETGYSDLQIVIDVGKQEVEFDYEGDHYRRTEHYYLMALASEQTTARTDTDAGQFNPIWVPLGEAVARLTFESEQRVARQAIEVFNGAATDKSRE